VAGALIKAAERRRVGERYIIGNWNTTQHDLNTLIAKVAGVMAPVIPVPFLVAQQGSKLGEWATKTILRKPPFVPAFVVEMLKQMQQYDCSKGLRELRYPPSSVETAIRDALARFTQNGYA
ncbi:MAG: epimerase, partial [Nitrospirota bacterium]|nr:epimerase [Nitrospirota bacterium]